MAVVSLVRRRNDELKRVLRALMDLADRDELFDTNITWYLDGREWNTRTGLYLHSPAHAVRAAVRSAINLAGEDTYA